MSALRAGCRHRKSGKGWTAACDLRPSQELRTEDGWVRCGEFVTTGESEFVYNFTVAEGHTYFVGDPVTWGFAFGITTSTALRGEPNHCESRRAVRHSRCCKSDW